MDAFSVSNQPFGDDDGQDSGEQDDSEQSFLQGDEETILKAHALRAEIEAMRSECEALEKQTEIVRNRTAARARENELQQEIVDQINARVEAMNATYLAKKALLEKEKEACKQLFKQKHEIQKKLAAKKAKFEKDKEERAKKVEYMENLVKEYEAKYLSMPWAAEYKKMYDEEKRLDEANAALHASIEEKKKQVAAIEEEMANTDPHRSWVKFCVAMAGDYVACRRLEAEIEETDKKIAEAEERRQKSIETAKSVAEPMATSFVVPALPPSTPYSAGQMRQSFGQFKTPAPAATPVAKKNYASPYLQQSPAKTPRLDMQQNPRTPGSAMSVLAMPSAASPMINEKRNGNKEMASPRNAAFAAPAPLVSRSPFLPPQEAPMMPIVSPRSIRVAPSPMKNQFQAPAGTPKGGVPPPSVAAAKPSPRVEKPNPTPFQPDVAETESESNFLGEDFFAYGNNSSGSNGDFTNGNPFTFNFGGGGDDSPQNGSDDGGFQLNFGSMGVNDDDGDGDGSGFNMFM